MCFYCRCKTTRPSVTTHVVTFDDCIIIIKNVPCEECEECGEATAENMLRLENGRKLCLDCFHAYSRFDV